MTRSLTRIMAATVVVAVSLVGGVAMAGSASAAETVDGPLVSFQATPVDPQPVVPGHEGDVLLQVNVVMAGQAATAPVSHLATVKVAKAKAKAKRSR